MRLYVANFPPEADEDALRNAFEEHGKVVSVKIILDFATGERRGFAFVSMPIKHQAERAMKRLHDREFMGETLIVREARTQNMKNRRRGRDRRRGRNANYDGPERRKGERRRSERRGGSGRGKN